MRKKLSKKSREDLKRIGNTLAQLAEAVLLLVEREMHDLHDEELEKSPKKIANAMQAGRRQTPDEVTRYALTLQQAAYNPRLKVRPTPVYVKEINGDSVDVERNADDTRERNGASLDFGAKGLDKAVDSEGCD